MFTTKKRNIHALLFGLSEDLAGELTTPLTDLCLSVDRESGNIENLQKSQAEVIFCGADVDLVSRLRGLKPEAPIVVVSRHPEVSGWLDSIEAGATDYCAAPFERSQLGWILEASQRCTQFVPA